MQFACDHRFLLFDFVLHTANGVEASRLNYNNLINKTWNRFGILVCTLGKSARLIVIIFPQSIRWIICLQFFVSSICQAISSIAFIAALLYLSTFDCTDACALDNSIEKKEEIGKKNKEKRLQSKRTIVGLKANHCVFVLNHCRPLMSHSLNCR